MVCLLLQIPVPLLSAPNPATAARQGGRVAANLEEQLHPDGEDIDKYKPIECYS